MKKIKNYESDILKFRDLKESDAAHLLKIYSDKEAMKYRRNPPMENLEDAKQFITEQNLETENHFKLRKGVELKGKQELIGSVLYKFSKKIETECVIGYSIGKDYWGKGIGREVVSLLIESFHYYKKVSLIKAWVHKENIGSHRVLEINDFNFLPQKEFSDLYLYVRFL